jgi:SAM-dependent methyltransferase
MNERELAANRMLTQHQVQDLNRNPVLTLDSCSFDAAIFTVSVEYLTQPFAVFKEVARVLKPGAPFVVAFSERWFPPKVIQLWTHLHSFERLALVMDHFRLSESFEKLHTYSLRGHLRPADDADAQTHPFADPVFAVWGSRLPD